VQIGSYRMSVQVEMTDQPTPDELADPSCPSEPIPPVATPIERTVAAANPALIVGG
jgi:hypothetical protein